MSIDAPDFPGETRIRLSEGLITSAHCTNPARAFDDDTSTFAAFTGDLSRFFADFTVPLSQNTWIDSGIVLNQGDVVDIDPTGSGIVNPPGAPAVTPVTPKGSNPLTIIDDSGEPYGSWAAQDGVNVTGYCLVIVARDDGTGQPGRDEQDGWNGGTDGTWVYTSTNPTPQRLWFQFNALGNYYGANVGSFHVSVRPFLPLGLDRYVRSTWYGQVSGQSGDLFITRMRLLMTGDAAINAAVALESSLGAIDTGDDPGPNVPLPYIPLPVGGDVHELFFNPPVLGRGIVFYPDYLATGPSETGTVDLYQLQVYYDNKLSGEENPMPLADPELQWSQVGVQQLYFFPWAGASGPYDDTTKGSAHGLQSLAIGTSHGTAKVTGGETVFELAAFETARQVKFKAMAEIIDIRIIQILRGGTTIVDPASGPLGEVQYNAADFTDRAPYFRFVGVSDNGDGTYTFKGFKCKLDGNIAYNLEKDKATDFEADFSAYWDATAVRADGSIGGIIEELWGQNGEQSLHS